MDRERYRKLFSGLYCSIQWIGGWTGKITAVVVEQAPCVVLDAWALA